MAKTSKAKVKKAYKHTHRRRVRYPARFSATTGYVFLAASWLLLIGIIGVSALEAMFAMWPESIQAQGAFWHTATGAYSVGNDQELSVGIKAVLALMLIGLAIVSSHFVAVHSSRMVRRLIRVLRLKVTVRYLLFMKCFLALAAPILMLVAILGLPTGASTLGYVVVGACGTFSVLSILFFSIQHALARHSKMDVKNIL